MLWIMAARLTPTSYVVLGMVSVRGPSTSYDLERAVQNSVGYFWPFPHAQLYSEPKRLVELGMLEVESEEEGRRRHTYTVTPLGRAVLGEWLAEPTEEPLQVRDVAELKLFFGEFTERPDLLRLSEEQVEQHGERIATYEAIQARFGERADVADRMVPLRLGLAMEYAALRFWEELKAERTREQEGGGSPGERSPG